MRGARVAGLSLLSSTAVFHLHGRMGPFTTSVSTVGELGTAQAAWYGISPATYSEHDTDFWSCSYRHLGARHCCSRAFVAFVGGSGIGGARRELDRYRCRTSAVRRRSARLEVRSSEAAFPNNSNNDNDNDNRNGNSNNIARQRQHATPAAVIFELEHDGKEDTTLAVYGKLHRLLGADHSRRLLGAETVATLTDLNYLVMHRRDGGGRWFCDGKSQRQDGGGDGGSRLALGDRRWDICGIDQKGPPMDALMRGTWQEQDYSPGVNMNRLERTIESVLNITSRFEVLSAGLTPVAGRRQNNQSEGLLRSVMGDIRKRWQRFSARVQANRALSQTRSSKELSARNPLLLIGVGALMSRKHCEAILGEARGGGAWAPWDGDLGEGSEATNLKCLPLSGAQWAGKAGDAVRARIASVYGIQRSSVTVDAGDVFVCKIGEEGPGPAETLEEQRQRRRREGRLEGAVDGATQPYSVAADFRRSKSLITFCVALSAEETPSWAVCVEQRGQCVRPNGQGAGVVFSGKLRHASVVMAPETSVGERSGENGGGVAQQKGPPVFLLRGYASIQHPRVRGDVVRWQWGSPAWHVDAPWVTDQDILNRAWTAGGSDGVAGETKDSSSAAAPFAHEGAATAGGHLKRMNSSAAHRYYRQGLGGMGIPVVDPLGRPVVDLVERGPSWLPGSDKTADVTLTAVLRRRFPWDRRRQVGKAGLSTHAGTSPRMDAALQELFGDSQSAGGEHFLRVPVPPIKYVFVDPRYRGFGLGRRLFLEAMCSLAGRGFRFALIVVEDNGSGGLFGFYEEMGFVGAGELLGIPRSMIAPIPPPAKLLR